MKKRKKRVPKRRPLPSRGSDSILDVYNVDRLLETEKKFDQVSRFHWDYFYELAYQRKQIKADLVMALHQACLDKFHIQNWFRVVRAKYANTPLSVTGSLVDPGGRFNIGRIYSQCFPPFPALYLGEDFNTCVQEVFPSKLANLANALKDDDMNLGSIQSLHAVRVSGLLEKVLDLGNTDSLKPFVQTMKNINLPQKFFDEAKRLSINLQLIRSPKKMLSELMHKNWKYMPTVYDIPSNPQVFGQLVYHAGIDGILYPSARTGKKCLAIYTRNFAHTSSEIEITDEVASCVSLKKINRSNFRDCE